MVGSVGFCWKWSFLSGKHWCENLVLSLKEEVESFGKSVICNILILSFIQTYGILLSTRQTTVAVCRQSDGSDGQTGILWGFLSDFRGRTSACFPVAKQGGINYPPTFVGPPFLSRKELRFACFPFAELLDSCRPMSLGSYHPANLLIRTDSKQSLENRNGSRSEVCLSNRLRLCSLCALAHPSFLSLYLRMRSRGADPTVYPLDIRRSMAISLNTS